MNEKNKVRITYNETLDPIFVFYCKNSEIGKRLGWDSWTPPSREEMIKRIQHYREVWNPFEEYFFKTMEDIVGSPSLNKIVDVHVVSGNPRQIGYPIIIKSDFPDRIFVITMIHELIHYYFRIHKLSDDFTHSEKSESKLTQKHILVFSIMKYFFCDIIKQPDFLEDALENSKKHETNEYVRAWDFANKNYLEIIKTFSKNIKNPGN